MFAGDISPVLEDNLKDIKIIEGSFKVTRSFALVSLFFFKSLEEIQNSNKKEFSVTVMENDNLQKLFPRKVKVRIKNLLCGYNQDCITGAVTSISGFWIDHNS